MTGNAVPVFVEVFNLHLYTFNGRVHKTSGSARGAFFSQYVPGFNTQAQLKFHFLNRYLSIERKTEINESIKPVDVERITRVGKVADDFLQILPHVMGKHVFVV